MGSLGALCKMEEASGSLLSREWLSHTEGAMAPIEMDILGGTYVTREGEEIRVRELALAAKSGDRNARRQLTTPRMVQEAGASSEEADKRRRLLNIDSRDRTSILVLERAVFPKRGLMACLDFGPVNKTGEIETRWRLYLVEVDNNGNIIDDDELLRSLTIREEDKYLYRIEDQEDRNRTSRWLVADLNL